MDGLIRINQYGYRGFNRFLMNPTAARAAHEVEWMLELRPQIVPLVVQTTRRPPAAALLTRENAIKEGKVLEVGPPEADGQERDNRKP